MDPRAMEPFARALLAYLEGDSSAELIVRRDDGVESTIPPAPFFRDESGFTEMENTAFEVGWMAVRGCPSGGERRLSGETYETADCITMHSAYVCRSQTRTDA